jgi:hypothetical protein
MVIEQNEQTEADDEYKGRSRKFSAISTKENFQRKEKFVKCDWPTQIYRRKKILKLKIFNNDIFGKFSVRGKFSCVEMGLKDN